MTTAATSTQTTTTTAPPPGAAAGGKPDGVGAAASQGKAGDTSPNTTTALGGAANGAAQPGSTEPAKTDGKPADGKPADGKPADGKPGESQAELELKFPDGFKADTELLDGFKALAKETGLRGEHAQKLADFYVKAQEKLNEGNRVAWETQHGDWKKTQGEDKELGGDLRKQNLSLTTNVIDKYAKSNPELQKYGLPELLKSAVGDHPGLTKLLFLMARDLTAEDTSRGTSSGGSKPTSSQDDLLREAYPTMFPKE